MGWSTWNTFEARINEQLIKQSADFMSTSTLRKAGYEYILIDDGWPACNKVDKEGNCLDPVPRDAQGLIQVNKEKFPNGLKSVSDYVHSKGLKIGIYTAVSPLTCAGYIGSYQYEEIDAQTFASWGIDFIKYDTCGTICGIHDGCIQNAAKRMRQGIEFSKKKIFFYIDHGNPTNPQKLFNPKNIMVKDTECIVKLATKPRELVWTWAQESADMFKSWLDIEDTWESTLSNIHNQIRTAEWQHCGFFHTPDMLTIGMGKQNFEEYKAQFFMWAVLGAPLILGNDIRVMEQRYVDLVTHDEILKIAQDKDCIMGSNANLQNSTEVWVRPLSDKSFCVVTLNKAETKQTVRVNFNGIDHQENDFWPSEMKRINVRDVYNKKSYGIFDSYFEVDVQPHSAEIFKVHSIF